MIEWIDSHGVEAMLIWSFFLIVAGTVPPLSENAGFFAKWGYAILKTISLNARGVSSAMNSMGIKTRLPEISLERKQEPPKE